MPCLANSPSMTRTWQRPHIARPPHTESISTPSVRAAWSRGVPIGKRPRFPDGVKTTSASWSVIATLDPTSGGTPAMAALTPAPRGIFVRRSGPTGGLHRGRFAEFADPARAVRIVSHHHISRHARFDNLQVQRIHDRRGHSGANCHGQEGRAHGLASRKTEA